MQRSSTIPGVRAHLPAPQAIVNISCAAITTASAARETSMTTTRRDFMVGAGAALAATHLTACSRAPDKPGVQESLAQLAEELLVDYPESATALGIDQGARAALKGKLADRSAAGQANIAQRVAARLQRLQAIDTAALDNSDRIDVDVLRTAHEFAAAGFA